MPTSPVSDTDQSEELADPGWFREPTVREHWLAAGLFVVFGVFFAALFYVEAGWNFRWVILGLAVLSVIHGVRHAARAIRPAEPRQLAEPRDATLGEGRDT